MSRYSPKQFEKEADYLVAKMTLDSLLSKGIIDEQDYAQIDTIIAKTYGSYLCDLCR